MNENSAKRAQAIRKGNTLFNAGKVEQAALIFKSTLYKDGLIRVGDHFFLEKHQPLRAYGYYRLAGDSARMDRIQDAFVFALRCWLDDDKPKEEPETNLNNTKENQKTERHLPKTNHNELPILGKNI